MTTIMTDFYPHKSEENLKITWVRLERGQNPALLSIQAFDV